MKLGKYSFGTGDRFGHQGKAQLDAIKKAREFAKEKQSERILREFFRVLIGLLLLLLGLGTLLAGAGFGLGWAVMIVVLGIAVLSGSISFGL